jgi:hypothetical protein
MHRSLPRWLFIAAWTNGTQQRVGHAGCTLPAGVPVVRGG